LNLAIDFGIVFTGKNELMGYLIYLALSYVVFNVALLTYIFLQVLPESPTIGWKNTNGQGKYQP
jgi:hypothetical protein